MDPTQLLKILEGGEAAAADPIQEESPTELPRWVIIDDHGSRPAVWIRTVERGRRAGHYVVARQGIAGWRLDVVPPDMVNTTTPVRTSVDAAEIARKVG